MTTRSKSGDSVNRTKREEKKKDNTVSGITNMTNCPTILTGMSHEMRTHMNSIVAFTFLMNSQECNDTEKKQFSNHILNSCEQLMFLFDNFLDSAIIDTGNSRSEARSCNLDSIFDDLLAEFRVILRREDHKELVLVLENQGNSTEEIFMDTNGVTRVIRSLFQNALYNTKSGYIKLGYNLREGAVTFYILDSGDGYQKCREFLVTDDLNEALSKHNDTPSAISLTLARKLITMMGGRIWTENNGANGSGVYFSVPVRKAETPNVPIDKYTSNNSRIAI